jgi:hypothetical protein
MAAIETSSLPVVQVQELRHTFCFYLQVHSIKFDEIRPFDADTGIYQISLYHPKAETRLVQQNIEVGAPTDLQELALSLYFSAEHTSILSIIRSEYCTLTIKGPRGVYALRTR